MRLFGKKKLTESELEEKKLRDKLAELNVGSDEYDKVLSRLERYCALQEKRKESNRRIPKEGRAKLLNTALSGLCLGGLAFGISRFELKGNLFTGDNKGSINSIVKIASRIFFGV